MVEDASQHSNASSQHRKVDGAQGRWGKGGRERRAISLAAALVGFNETIPLKK